MAVSTALDCFVELEVSSGGLLKTPHTWERDCRDRAGTDLEASSRRSGSYDFGRSFASCQGRWVAAALPSPPQLSPALPGATV